MLLNISLGCLATLLRVPGNSFVSIRYGSDIATALLDSFVINELNLAVFYSSVASFIHFLTSRHSTPSCSVTLTLVTNQAWTWMATDKADNKTPRIVRNILSALGLMCESHVLCVDTTAYSALIPLLTLR
eukprot:TRINITY_DN1096_c0_g2_i3.p1 TRINITY_DN1096_c0_g2~~TRINITY_DN1096_c0_g2_i3.p1  ORF type:complete len:130 (+),score=13.20 TRINITY_DN1096_c0_g2_i3:210-599(+)